MMCARGKPIGSQECLRKVACRTCIAAAALNAALLSGCASVYPYRPPLEFEGHPWGQRIEEFHDLMRVGAEHRAWTNCDIPLPAEIGHYIKVDQSPRLMDRPAHLTQYLFCYDGIASRFCGAAVEFDSEEFEQLDAASDPGAETTFQHIRRETIRRYGRPHRGELVQPRITITTVDDKIAVPPLMKPEHLSWCARNDPHAPKECPATVILNFDFLLGHGLVLYGTPMLHELVEELQSFAAQPINLYEVLFHYAKPDRMPVLVGCTEELARQHENPFDTTPSDAVDHTVFGESALDRAAYDRDELRELPVKPLTDEDFRVRVTSAYRELDEHRDWKSQAYWWGYLWGIGRLYYGERFGSEEGHKKWLAAHGATSEFVQEVGRGYADGLKATLTVGQ